MRLSLLHEIPHDQRLRKQWNGLALQMDRAEVFYTWEWAIAVDRAYHSSLKPLLLLGYEGDVLAGVAALATDQAGTQISFLAGSTADYCDFICPRQHRPEFVEGVFEELSKLHALVLRLANLPADSATSLNLKGAAEKHGYLVFSRPAYRCAQIRLGTAAERQALKQSVVKRKAFRSYLKGLEKTGGAAWII